MDLAAQPFHYGLVWIEGDTGVGVFFEARLVLFIDYVMVLLRRYCGAVLGSRGFL